MKKFSVQSLFIGLIFICLCALTACSSRACPPHDYQIDSRVEATCTEDGSITYKCSKCGEEYTEQEKARGHKLGPEATTTSPQICLDCGVVLKEKITGASPIVTRSLAINHYVGVASSYCITPIDTQVHSKYTLPTQHYYASDLANITAKPLDLDVSIPIQEFYTHDILSVYRLGTNDGKTFTTPSGFKVKFNFETIESKSVEDLAVASSGDFFDNYENCEALKIVRLYQSSAYYGGIFLIVDFSDSYIEIEKDGDSANARKISLWDDQEKVVRTEVEISDSNSRLFYDEGTYRILFKYNIAWATNPTSAVYDKNGKACYPYGLINDQYDYFYVQITDEKDGVLVPENYGTKDELFYQLRVDSVNADSNKLFLPSNGKIQFGDKIKFHVDNVLDYQDGGYSFKGNRLNKFTLTLYRYDYDSDTGTNGINSYVFHENVDLMPLLSGDDTFEVIMKKDTRLRERPCKILVTCELFDKSNSQIITLQQTYIFTFDWE